MELGLMGKTVPLYLQLEEKKVTLVIKNPSYLAQLIMEEMNQGLGYLGQNI